jgi:hypothetical protein
MAKPSKESAPGWVDGVIGALIDRHGQVDIRLQKVAVTVPGSPLGLEVNGTVTVSVHLRDLSDDEKQAHVASNVAAIRH